MIRHIINVILSLNTHLEYNYCCCSGTPGVGKSMMSRLLAEKTGLTWLDVGKLATDNECLEEYDEVYQCRILDEDKVITS